RLPMAIAANAAVAAAGWLARTVTLAGAVTGFAIGVAIFVSTGAPGWTMLLVAFLAAAVATRIGFRRKASLGIAESRGGRRGPGNAIANTGLAACAALLTIGLRDPGPARLAMAAALVTASSDTIASEVGKVWGTTPRLVVGFR